MRDGRAPAAGLDTFWEQADSEASCEHPLERELCYRLDALERYRQLILDAQAGGRDDVVDVLASEHDYQARLVRELRSALQNRPIR
ncbi:MAG: hypothetical protein WEE89_09685 [Gemmatimonadota bacterium]